MMWRVCLHLWFRHFRILQSACRRAAKKVVFKNGSCTYSTAFSATVSTAWQFSSGPMPPSTDNLQSMSKWHQLFAQDALCGTPGQTRNRSELCWEASGPTLGKLQRAVAPFLALGRRPPPGARVSEHVPPGLQAVWSARPLPRPHQKGFQTSDFRNELDRTASSAWRKACRAFWWLVRTVLQVQVQSSQLLSCQPPLGFIQNAKDQETRQNRGGNPQIASLPDLQSSFLVISAVARLCGAHRTASFLARLLLRE